MQDDFKDFNSDDVERWLHGMHTGEDRGDDRRDEQDIAGSAGQDSMDPVDPDDTPEYNQIREALTAVFIMCEKAGYSIQIAISDVPRDGEGNRVGPGRLTLCGHMTPDNIPCEIMAATVVYQTDHTFSHMVLAMASAGAPLINMKGDIDDDGQSH